MRHPRQVGVILIILLGLVLAGGWAYSRLRRLQSVTVSLPPVDSRPRTAGPLIRQVYPDGLVYLVRGRLAGQPDITPSGQLHFNLILDGDPLARSWPVLAGVVTQGVSLGQLQPPGPDQLKAITFTVIPATQAAELIVGQPLTARVNLYFNSAGGLDPYGQQVETQFQQLLTEFETNQPRLTPNQTSWYAPMLELGP